MPVTLTSNVNNATYLITVHTTRKHSPEFEEQAEDRTQEGSTPTRETRLPRGLPLETKHMVDRNDVIRPCIIFFGGAKLVSMNTQSKNLDFAWIRNAFFVERNKYFKNKQKPPIRQNNREIGNWRCSFGRAVVQIFGCVCSLCLVPSGHLVWLLS